MYFLLRLAAEAIIVLAISTYTNSTPYIRTNTLFAFIFTGLAAYTNFTGIVNKIEWTEFSSIVELIKTYFASELEADQVNIKYRKGKPEMRLNDIIIWKWKLADSVGDSVDSDQLITWME